MLAVMTGTPDHTSILRQQVSRLLPVTFGRMLFRNRAIGKMYEDDWLCHFSRNITTSSYTTRSDVKIKTPGLPLPPVNEIFSSPGRIFASVSMQFLAQTEGRVKPVET